MPTDHKTLFILALFSRTVIVLVILIVALPTVSALNSESGHNIETLGLSNELTSVPGEYFVHTATVANTVGQSTFIDHPLISGNPDAIVLVTQSWAGGSINNHPIGVWYSSSSQKWAIFNQDIASMTTNATFNVLIPATDATALIHAATAANIINNSTFIDHPLINGNPYAIVLVTQNWNPGGGAGTYNSHTIGVWYSSSSQKWAVFNQDLASMPTDAAFNVLIPATGTDAFVHTATVANISGFWTYIDHPLTNNNPNAILLVTQNWNPGGGSGIHNIHPIAVLYSIDEKKWTVTLQTTAVMLDGAAFNIIVNDHKVYLPLVLR